MFSLDFVITDELGREVTIEQIRQKLSSPDIAIQLAQQATNLLVENAPRGTGNLAEILGRGMGQPEAEAGGWTIGTGNIAMLGELAPAPPGTISAFLRGYRSARAKVREVAQVERQAARQQKATAVSTTTSVRDELSKQLSSVREHRVSLGVQSKALSEARKKALTYLEREGLRDRWVEIQGHIGALGLKEEDLKQQLLQLRRKKKVKDNG